VGGMDKIVDGFKDKVGSLIQYNTKVLDIKTRGDGVTVVIEYKGVQSSVNADYCISNIPLPLLKGITNNFSEDFDAAIKKCKYDPTCKLGWQANERCRTNGRSTVESVIRTIRSRKCGIRLTTISPGMEL
jgi:monoamine oxidase